MMPECASPRYAGSLAMVPVFLLSPARCNGPRADQLARSRSPMGVALRTAGAPLEAGTA